jgi:ribosomal protein S27AE
LSTAIGDWRQMPVFVTLTCPSCGGKLEITPEIDRFACGHCGNEHIVRRGGGIISIVPVVEGLREVRAGVDRTASELAIIRLKQELAELNNTYTAYQREMAALESISVRFFNKKRKAEIQEAFKELERQGKAKLEEIDRHLKIINA